MTRISCQAQPRRCCRIGLTVAAMIQVFAVGCTGPKEWIANGFKVGPNYCPPAAPTSDEWIDAADPRLRSTAEVAATYIRMRACEERLALAHKNVGLQKETLRIISLREKKGLVTELDVQQAVLQYRDTVLRANEEVENGLVAFLREQDRVASLGKSARAAARSVELAMRQYEKGLIYYQPLLDSERAMVQHQDALAESGGLVGIHLVSVYKALGGGWRARLADSQADETPSPPTEARTR